MRRDSLLLKIAKMNQLSFATYMCSLNHEQIMVLYETAMKEKSKYFSELSKNRQNKIKYNNIKKNYTDYEEFCNALQITIIHFCRDNNIEIRRE